MILSFAKDFVPVSFAEGTTPRLLTASNITRASSQYARVLHSHNDRLELLLVRTGSGYYIVDDEKFEIKAGNIVVCNEGSLHDEVPEYNRQLSMIAIAIDDVYIKGLPKNHLIPDTVKPVLKVGKEFVLMDAMFQSIFESLAFGTEEKQETCIYLTQALLSLVLHSFEEYGIPSPVTPRKNSSALLHDIKKYIDDNFAEDLSLPKISEQFFISQSYLSHLFKRKLGYSPMHYIVRRRIGEAQLLLVFTKKSITEIASEVGFDNLSHFNVQFKKYVGLSPLAYRKRNILPDPDEEEDEY